MALHEAAGAAFQGWAERTPMAPPRPDTACIGEFRPNARQLAGSKSDRHVSVTSATWLWFNGYFLTPKSIEAGRSDVRMGRSIWSSTATLAVAASVLAGGGYANVDAQVGSLVAPILTSRQAEGETGYYSALVVRADSPIRSLADMKGRSLGYVDFNSTSGYLVPRAKFREQGLDPDTYFGKTSFAGGQTQAVMALANGQFEAAILQASGGDPANGFTRGALHTMARRGFIDLKDFRIIWTAGPIPSEAVIVRTDRPRAMIDLARGALAAIAYDEPELWTEIGQLDGSAYTSVTRDHYKDIIDLRAAGIAQRRAAGGRP